MSLFIYVYIVLFSILLICIFLYAVLHHISKKIPYKFTDDDRTKSAELRERRHQIRMKELEREEKIVEMELQDVNEALEERNTQNAGLNPDDLLMGIFRQIISSKMVPSTTVPQSQSVVTPEKIHLSDEQILRLVQQYPMINKCSNDEITVYGSKFSLDDDTIQRTIKLIKK